MNAAARAEQARGAYPIGIAARLAHLAPVTARRWVRGYEYDYRGERRRSAPVDYLSKPFSGAAPAVLDFEQLLTLALVSAFNRRGLGLPTIKRAARRAKELYGTRNPFVTKGFRSDGNSVFEDLQAPGRERELVDVLSDQREFREIVEPFLFKDIVFIGENAGEWWPLGPDRTVVLIPTRQFGAPHVAGRGVRTDVVVRAVEAEGGDNAARGGGRGLVRADLGAGCGRRRIRGSMARKSGLTFVLDQNLGAPLLQMLRLARMEPVGHITSLMELGYAPDADDEDWMPHLGQRGPHVAVTRDGDILRAAIRLEAWRRSGLTLLLLDGQWGQLPLPRPEPDLGLLVAAHGRAGRGGEAGDGMDSSARGSCAREGYTARHAAVTEDVPRTRERRRIVVTEDKRRRGR